MIWGHECRSDTASTDLLPLGCETALPCQMYKYKTSTNVPLLHGALPMDGFSAMGRLYVWGSLDLICSGKFHQCLIELRPQILQAQVYVSNFFVVVCLVGWLGLFSSHSLRVYGEVHENDRLLKTLRSVIATGERSGVRKQCVRITYYINTRPISLRCYIRTFL